MKKIILILMVIGFISTPLANSTTKKRTRTFDYYEKQHISKYACAFHAPDKHIGELGFIYIECDKNKRLWFRYECGLGFSNVEGITDGNGRKWLGMYNIYKGKHMYIKLDNEEIITLTCKDISFIHTGYYTGNLDIYKEYKIYSYFDLTQELINKLSEHEIIKMRCELKYEVSDMVLDKPINLKSTFEKITKEFTEKIESQKRSDELKENPLKGF